MDNKKTKKEMISQYKERKVIGGVFIIKNTQSGQIMLEASANLQGSRNRFEFSRQTGVAVNLKMQNDWNRLGGLAFVFEVLEELEKKETQTEAEFREDLEFLKEVWMEKLKGQVFY
ncbi:MAG: GIY-YIG nuclease family protein [Clostridiaceae bacterium]|nr:GIY-YIG nuclease family protein [Clostridiaceae bacterium]